MTSNNNYFDKLYEGCGEEGPIRCIFLCEFHPIAGPKITCQVPDNYISKDVFDTVSVYIIPKAQLQRSTLSVTLLGSKILGFPVRIEDKKYPRNAFHFNVCFVCDAWARTVHYEPVVTKLSDYLMAMELENSFLSQQTAADNQGEEKRAKLAIILRQVMEDLNNHGACTLTEGTTTTHLKVVRLREDPLPVLDHQVPIFLPDQNKFIDEQWDLTTHQVYPYIDGFNHVAKIAAEADVENNLVKACVQNLVYYGVVALIPIFQYCNVYTATPKLKLLASNKSLQQRCIEYVSKNSRQVATLRDIFRMYSSMTYGTTIKDLCVRLNPHNLHINERKLVQFGILEGLIRRVYKYPIYLADNLDCEESVSNYTDLQRSFSGVWCLDEICCSTGINSLQIEDQLERDSNVVLLWK